MIVHKYIAQYENPELQSTDSDGVYPIYEILFVPEKQLPFQMIHGDHIDTVPSVERICKGLYSHNEGSAGYFVVNN